MNHCRAFGGVEVEQHLGVRLRAKRTSLCLELAPQRAVVINLAVESHDELPVRALHRLGAALGKVDDGQAPMTEAHAVVRGMPFSEAIGPPRGHMVANANELRMVDAACRRTIGVNSCDAAHLDLSVRRPAARYAGCGLRICATRNEPMPRRLVMTLATPSGTTFSRNPLRRPCGIGRISPLRP